MQEGADGNYKFEFNARIYYSTRDGYCKVTFAISI